MAERDHLEAIPDLAGAAGIDEGRLVAEGELGPRHIEMAELDGDVLRLDAGAQEMDDVEMLGELGELLIVGERARPFAAVGVVT